MLRRATVPRLLPILIVPLLLLGSIAVVDAEDTPVGPTDPNTTTSGTYANGYYVVTVSTRHSTPGSWGGPGDHGDQGDPGPPGSPNPGPPGNEGGTSPQPATCTARRWTDAAGIHSLTADCHTYELTPPSISNATYNWWEELYGQHPNEDAYLLYVDDDFKGIVWVPIAVPTSQIRITPDPVTSAGSDAIAAADPYDAALQVMRRVPLPELRLRQNPDVGLVNVPTWYWVEGWDGRPFGIEESVTLPAPGASTPGDLSCARAPALPPPPAVGSDYAITRRTMPPGVPEIMDAVFGGRQFPVSQGYGPSHLTLEPTYHGYPDFHKGLDFPMEVGQPLYAPNDGVVEQAIWSGSIKVATLKFGNGLKWHFLHLDRQVARGPVKKGDLIGISGNSGYPEHSTGPHLHLGLEGPDGRFLPPEQWRCSQSIRVKIAVRVQGGVYEWDFGDGTVRVGSLGKVYPRVSDVQHTYTSTSLGKPRGYPISLTVRYTATYSVNGGPPRPLPAQARSYDAEYRVQEAQSILQARP